MTCLECELKYNCKIRDKATRVWYELLRGPLGSGFGDDVNEHIKRLLNWSGLKSYLEKRIYPCPFLTAGAA